MNEPIVLPTYNVSLGQAVDIVKYRLDDRNLTPEAKTHAIEHVANMATHNSVTKDELVGALRWLFEHYSFY